MKHISKAIILASSLLAASAAVAANWVLVFDDSRVTIYIDKDTQKVNSSVITYWEKRMFKATQNLSDNTPFKEALLYRYIDCNIKISAIRSETYYDKNGNVVFSMDLPFAMTPNKPGSLDEITYKIMCSHQANPTPSN